VRARPFGSSDCRLLAVPPSDSLPLDLWTPAAGESVAHCPPGKLQLPAQVGAIREEGGDGGTRISIVPRQRFVDLVWVLRLLFERAHVVILLCRCHSRRRDWGLWWRPAAPVCSQYVPFRGRVNQPDDGFCSEGSCWKDGVLPKTEGASPYLAMWAEPTNIIFVVSK